MVGRFLGKEVRMVRNHLGPPMIMVYTGEKKRSYDRGRVRKFRDRIWAIKSIPCMDCGIQFHPVAMDFDHREGKTLKLSQAPYLSWEKVLEEIKKCDIVCSNCHRLRTLHRNQYGTVPG